MSTSLGIQDTDFYQIIENVKNNRISILGAKVGSGKSTLVGEALVDYGYKVLYLELTRQAVHSLFDYQNEKLKDSVFVGFAAESYTQYVNKELSLLMSNYSNPHIEDTQLVYATYGHFKVKFFKLVKSLLKDIVKDGSMQINKTSNIKLKFFDVIIFDEAHSKNVDLELIARFWKFTLEHLNITLPHLMLTSGTIEPEDTLFEDAIHHKIETKSYPVKIEYSLVDYDLNDKNLIKDYIDVVCKKHNEFKIKSTGSTWIVFCSGTSEVNTICDKLNEINNSNLIALPNYSDLTEEEKKITFDPVIPGQRKIIVTTNIMETAVTVDGADYVFCLGREKNIYTSNGNSCLTLDFISKSSANQRSGRVGRTCPGNVYRMYTEEFYNNMDSNRKGELYRVPLHLPIIEILNVGINPSFLLKDMKIESKISETLRTLEHLEMIEKSSENKVRFKIEDKLNLSITVTEIGVFSTQHPLNVRYSACLFHAIKNKLPLFESICIITILNYSEGGSYLYYPRFKGSHNEVQEDRSNHYNLYFSEFESDNIFGFFINLFNFIFERSVDESFSIKYKQFSNLCNSNFLNYKKVLEVLRIIKQISSSLNVKIEKQISEDFVNTQLYPILIKVFSDRKCTMINRKSCECDGIKYFTRYPFYIEYSDNMLALSMSENRTGSNVSRFVNLSIPIEIEEKIIDSDSSEENFIYNEYDSDETF